MTATPDVSGLAALAICESLLLALCANKAIAPEHFMQIWGRLNPAG